MSDEKPIVRNICADYIAVNKNYCDRYRRNLEFHQPWTGKKQQIVRVKNASVNDLVYIMDVCAQALASIQDDFDRDIKIAAPLVNPHREG